MTVKRFNRDKLIRVCRAAAIIALTVSAAHLFMQYVFFRLPEPSYNFDCDDATLLMAERFTDAGIKVKPILGNVNRAGEAYLDSDHVWLIANICGVDIAFDWGRICLDRQHYEGYVLTQAQLLHFVEQDSARTTGLAASLPGD